VWWHVGRPNFGDDINPSFFERIDRGRVRFAHDRRKPHVLGAGSILKHATPASIVCGSGFLEPPRRPVKAGQIVAVRGELSATACNADSSVLLGDSLVIVDAFMKRPEPRHRYGYVPHVTNVRHWRMLDRRRQHVIIDPAWAPWQVIDAIAACEVVFSQSLHGLIVADALGVPNVWVAPSEAMRGGRFKFDDYCSTLEEGKDMVPEGTDVFMSPERYDAGISRYRFCKARYREALAAACARCHEARARD